MNKKIKLQGGFASLSVVLTLTFLIIGGVIFVYKIKSNANKQVTLDQNYVTKKNDTDTPLVKDGEIKNSEEVVIDTKKEQNVYSLDEVKKHKIASDCWTLVNNVVYDVTSWVNRHPGGSKKIISMCGIDATKDFTDEHSGQYRPEKELASFKIGILLK